MPPLANGFLSGPVAKVLLRTALPIVFITSVNGLLTVADAILLGAFVGPEALAAVTLMFPASMLLFALATMVSSGMASIVARHLGGGHVDKAAATFTGAHGLSFLVSAILVAAFAAFGGPLVGAATADPRLFQMSHKFLAILVVSAPIMFLASVHSDALRIEGKVGFMAVAGLVTSLGNIGFNVLLIAGFGLGVVGSAVGTALAQALALGLMLSFRVAGKSTLPVPRSWANLQKDWAGILALGAPRSLSFLGIALGSTATIAAIRLHVVADQDMTIAAYGAVMRMMTFAYLPVLGLSLAMQAVVGNNHGAGLHARSYSAIRYSVGAALVYCLSVEVILLVFRNSLGNLFFDDPLIIAEVGRILQMYAALYLTLGPMVMIASYLQSIGDAKGSAFLSLARTYLYAVPFTFALPLLFGETGIWLALPLADLLLVITTVLLLGQGKAGASLLPPA
jgi:MATE family, multidrug efflux pump